MRPPSSRRPPSKRQGPQKKSTAPQAKVARKPTKKELNAYFKSYKKGTGDFHLPLFRQLHRLIAPTTVFYPGCYRHITPSLVFPRVVYVDSDPKVAGCFTDPLVLGWVRANKEYEADPQIVFKCANFESSSAHWGPAGGQGFDLAMSMSAGIVTTSCARRVRRGGHFLVSDAHFDARMLSLDADFVLTHVWCESTACFVGGAGDLEGHFTTRDGRKMSHAMVQESMEKPKARRSFKLEKEAMFYLFQKRQ